MPQKIDFSVQFPRARQTYQGLLWTEGKNAIAGTVCRCSTTRTASSRSAKEPCSARMRSTRTLVGRRRQGQPSSRLLRTGSDRYTLDGLARSESELFEALSKAVKDNEPFAVLLRVSDTVPLNARAACGRCRSEPPESRRSGWPRLATLETNIELTGGPGQPPDHWVESKNDEESARYHDRFIPAELTRGTALTDQNLASILKTVASILSTSEHLLSVVP